MAKKASKKVALATVDDDGPKALKKPREGAPPVPEMTKPAADDIDLDLFGAVQRTLYALPSRFQSELSVTGVLATDLHAFNTALGASIEEQVVASLNALRGTWDSDGKYPTYSFVRSSQRFPDVRLQDALPNSPRPILMGIELKGWYVLAKESEPSGRYKVTPNACAPQDLLVVVPWALDAVVSGKPCLFDPFVVGARWAAEYRNWWWEWLRDTKTSPGIKLSGVTDPYPAAKADKVSDVPDHDEGGNFGRFARAGMMEDYKKKLMQEALVGIPLWAWQAFFVPFKGEAKEGKVLSTLRNLLKRVEEEIDPAADDAEEVASRLISIWRHLKGSG